MELKEKLSRLRRKQGWTQDRLAREMEVTRQTVSKWERGVIAPTAEKLIVLSRLYGVPLDELVNGEPQCGEPPATAVAVAEKPEAGEKRGKPGPLKIVGAIALAVFILLTVTASTITICSVAFKESERPKDEIVWIDDVTREDINPIAVQDWTGSRMIIEP